MMVIKSAIWSLLPFLPLFSPNSMILFLAILCLLGLSFKTHIPKQNKAFLTFFIFMLYSIIPSLLSNALMITMSNWIRISVMTIGYLLIIEQIKSYPQVYKNKLECTFRNSFSAAILLLAIAFFTGCLANSIFVNAGVNFFNKAACSISVLSWLLIFVYSKSSKHARLKSIFCYVAAMGLVSSMESESAILGSAIATIVLLLSMTYKNFYKLFSVAIAIAFIISPITIYIYTLHYTDFIPFELQPSWEHRIYIALNTISMILEKPFFGWGFNASKFLNLSPNGHVLIGEHLFPMFNFHPHNASLQILLDTGILGLLLFSATLMSTLLVVGKSNTLDPALKPYIYAGITSYLIIGQLNFNVWASWWATMPLVFGITASILSSTSKASAKMN